MKYYSQIKQDKYYIEQIIRFKKFGKFLDVGSHDGIFTSNTYALEKNLNWSGLCVEANPSLAERCSLNRPNSKVVQAAVWSEEVDVLFEFPRSGDDLLSRIAGMPHNENYFSSDFENSIKTKIKTRTISDILGKGHHEFDYFSLDVEGAELEALKGIDWSRTKFNFIALEFGLRQNFLIEIVNYLQDKNYKIHRINSFDADFVPI
jgi:FkbM family methyltransferase